LASKAGRPTRTRASTSRAISRAVAMVMRSVEPRVVQICLPPGSRVTLANDFAPVGVTRT
jgi:hypothetical protein